MKSEIIIDDAEKHFYDVKDASIPQSLNYTEHLIPGGEKMKLVFQTGNLAGIEFEVTYNHDERKFKLTPKEENGLKYPSYPNLPSVGDIGI
ncbi:MAG: hypothetical protein KGV44_00450 [Flavobacteriaceae bacterium]|nr:hypothetical protein [Flavobacteriaceae bacterium]